MNSIYEQLADFTEEQVSARVLEIRTWLGARLPSLDVFDPVLSSVWIAPLARYLIESEATIDSLEKFGQLSETAIAGIEDVSLQAQARQAIADSLSIPSVPAAFASGEIKVEATSSETIVIPQGTVFTAGSQTYNTNQPYLLRSAANTAGRTNERLLSRTADGTFVATVPVVAIEPGSAGNQLSGTVFTASVDIPNLVSLTAISNFVGGRSENDLQDLINTARTQELGRTLGTRDQVTAFLQVRTDIPDVQQVGVIGFGDPEMLRDKAFFAPVGGGKADIYIAASTYPTIQEVNLSATVTASQGGLSQLSLAVGRDVSPGFLRIVSVTDNETGRAAKITSERRGIDMSFTLDEQTPVIEDPRHGAFSAFQTATLGLELSEQLSVGAERAVTVRFQRISSVKPAQELVSSRFYRFVGGDTLVRAAVPVFLRINLRLSTPFDPELPDPDALKLAIAEEIMRRPMRPAVTFSELVQAATPHLSPDMAIDQIEYDALLVSTDGQVQRRATLGNYTVPVLPADQLSPRTVAIYTLPADVNVSVQQQIAYETP